MTEELVQPGRRFAVLIDGDNAPAKFIREMLAEVQKYGTATVKRVYGDWTSSELKSWKEVLLQFALQPIQQFAYTTGKNATDIALVIDAMDLLHSGTVDGFCIVASDSDYTKLGERIRASGLVMLGIGEPKTPKSFVSVCQKFISTELFGAKTGKSPAATPSAAPKKPASKSKPVAQSNPDANALKTRLLGAYESLSGSSDWVNLAAIGNYIVSNHPDFDTRTYGFAKLSDAVRSLDVFETQQQGLTILVRAKGETS